MGESGAGSSSDSDITDLSLIENETDEFGRRIMQHERETRLAKLEARQPFWRARPKSWMVERDADEQDLQHDIDGHGHRRTASVGSVGADPPLNVPREWGKRSRRRGSWLRRHESESGVQQVEAEQAEAPIQMDEDSIIPRRTRYTGDGWAAGSDSPLQTVETTPPSLRRMQRQTSSPSSMQHMNTTLKSFLSDDDFSAASILTSTPAINQRTRKIDDLVRKEIETVEKRGVTRRTLNQISERYSHESLRPSTAPASETDRLSRARSGTNESDIKSIKRSESPSHDDVPQPALPEPLSKATTLRNTTKSSHSRNDSMKLLQKLARVSSSMSPSPEEKKVSPDDPLSTKPIDTPEPQAPPPPLQDEKPPLKPSPSPPTTTNGISPLSTLPKSALSEVLHSAKSTLSPALGDSTLASLEHLLSSPPSTPPPSSSLHPPPPPLSQSAESLALESLTRRLSHTKSALHDTALSLQALESTPLPASSATPYIDPHTSRTVCAHCGGRYTSVWRALWTEFRENFYVYDAKTKWRVRLTWLGMVCVVWWVWLGMEVGMCAVFCQPRYARGMVGYGVDVHAPEFPFVLPGVLVARPVRWVWEGVEGLGRREMGKGREGEGWGKEREEEEEEEEEMIGVRMRVGVDRDGGAGEGSGRFARLWEEGHRAL